MVVVFACLVKGNVGEIYVKICLWNNVSGQLIYSLLSVGGHSLCRSRTVYVSLVEGIIGGN